MLSFGAPAAAWLALVLVPIAIFYFLRLRFRRQPVGSTFIWRLLVGRTDGGSVLRFRSLLLLLLQAAAVAFAVGALIDPALVARRLVRPGTVFLIDVSASMSSADGGSADGGSGGGGAQDGIADRLGRAAALARGEIEKLPADVPVAVFACAAEASLLGEPGTDRAGTIAALARVRRSSEGFFEDLVADGLTAWLAGREESWQACIVTDGGLDLGGRRIAAVFDGSLRSIIVGGGGSVGNGGSGGAAPIGVTGLRLEQAAPDALGDAAESAADMTAESAAESAADSAGRPAALPAAGPGGLEARFLVWNGSPSVREARLFLEKEGMLLALFRVEAGPGWSRQALPIQAAAGYGAYRLSVEGGSGPGSVYHLAVNPQRALSILLVGKAEPFLKAALEYGGLSYKTLPAFPDGLPETGLDLVIADGVSIPAGLRCNLLAFGPPPSDAPLAADGAANGLIAAQDGAHPLSRFIDWNGALAQGGRTFKVEGDVQVLATVSGRPAVVAWEREGFRSVLCGIDLSRSDLGLKSAFPVFLQNVFQWCVPRADDQSAFTLSVGEPVRRAEPPSFRVTGTSSVEVRRSGTLAIVTAHESGVFAWEKAGAKGFLAANPPSAELDTTPCPLLAGVSAVEGAGLRAVDSAPAQAPLAASFSTTRKSLQAWPIVLFLACLGGEWLAWRGLPLRKGRDR